ncbi:ATP-binding cassette domain-containing protein [Cytobacillus suaedae]|nr:ATP-binding cassette domain-containing protein [Cytobacillus suaedae]
MKKVAHVENLRLKFTGGESLLFKDLSSTFYQGEKVLLLGPSGCGKSSLLQVLTGLIPNSIDVPMKADSIEVPSSWGYVFQDPDTQFCMPFVDEEIAFVLENLQVRREKMNQKIEELLLKVGLNLDSTHTSINTLSGGMKQRLAIASVLALEPEVLFLDEPTAMLDPEGTKDIWDTIKNISQDKTVIIVEHKIDHVIDFIDRIILFDSTGQIIADGYKEEIFLNYKKEIREQGIWYPGVWDEYISERKTQLPEFTEEDANEVLRLENFIGYRNKEAKIHVPNCTVKAGEWIVIVGENGAGKSTLLHALFQFIKTSGQYDLMGTNIQHIQKLTKYLTFVFQNPEFQFITNSVYEEIAYALKMEKVNEMVIEEKVEELLTLFQLENHRKQHPYQLSMGQKRRLSVAASIVKGQQIMLLDEPTFGQDSKNTFALLELIEQYRRNGTTIVMVTHDKQIETHFATRVWHIEAGELTDDRVQIRPQPLLKRRVPYAN